MAEVRRHHKPGDTWMVIHGMVYDVSMYSEYHPGGLDAIMSGAGKDATKLFEKFHAWVNPAFMLEKCCLGYVEADSAADYDCSSSNDESDDEDAA
jgi:cytochrome-b5 reductase